MTSTVLNVPDISCEHCERTITGALTQIDGVRAVNVDIAGKQVYVDFDETHVSVDQMKDVLQEEDYPVESVGGALVQVSTATPVLSKCARQRTSAWCSLVYVTTSNNAMQNRRRTYRTPVGRKRSRKTCLMPKRASARR
jgi:copper chaperone